MFERKKTSGKLLSLPIDQIHPSPFQARKSVDEQELTALAQSIREYGLLQPVTVRKVAEGYELVAGERRLRACQLVAIGAVIVAAALMVIGLRNAKGKPLMAPLAGMDLNKQAEAGDRFTPDTLPAGTPHAEFVKATDAMNERLDALELSEVEIEEIEDPKV